MKSEESAVRVYGVLADRSAHTLQEIADSAGLTRAQAEWGLKHLRANMRPDVIVCQKRAHLSTHRLANGATEVTVYGEHVLKGIRTQLKNLIELIDVAKKNDMFADRRRNAVRQVFGMLEAAYRATGLTGDEIEETDEIVSESRERRHAF